MKETDRAKLRKIMKELDEGRSAFIEKSVRSRDAEECFKKEREYTCAAVAKTESALYLSLAKTIEVVMAHYINRKKKATIDTAFTDSML